MEKEKLHESFRLELGYLGSKRLNYSSFKTNLTITNEGLSFPPPFDGKTNTRDHSGFIQIPIIYGRVLVFWS